MGFAGCSQYPDGRSCASIAHAQSRGVLVASYEIPADSTLGRYKVVEVWVESRQDKKWEQLVVRLSGPHVDREPRVQIEGLEEDSYRHIWSERGGPPYEVWSAPSPLPNSLTLTRDGKSVSVNKKQK